jgi:tetratricopeptide (TPR) repeat protein
VHNNLGDALRKLGRYAEAREHLAAALAMTEKNRGPDDVFVAAILVSLGQVALGRGEPAAAIPLFERAEAIGARQPRPADLADARFNLARALWEAGRDRARSLALARRARAGLAAAGEAKRAELAAVDAWLARPDRARSL